MIADFKEIHHLLTQQNPVTSSTSKSFFIKKL